MICTVLGRPLSGRLHRTALGDLPEQARQSVRRDAGNETSQRLNRIRSDCSFFIRFIAECPVTGFDGSIWPSLHHHCAGRQARAGSAMSRAPAGSSAVRAAAGALTISFSEIPARSADSRARSASSLRPPVRARSRRGRALAVPRARPVPAISCRARACSPTLTSTTSPRPELRLGGSTRPAIGQGQRAPERRECLAVRPGISGTSPQRAHSRSSSRSARWP